MKLNIHQMQSIRLLFMVYIIQLKNKLKHDKKKQIGQW